MIADRDRGHPGADFADDPGALVAEHAREQAFAVEPVERVGVGVANARRHDLDEDFAGLGAFEIELDDLEGLLRFEGDGGAGFQSMVSIRHPVC